LHRYFTTACFECLCRAFCLRHVQHVCAGSGAALRLTVNRATMFLIALATKLNYNGFELNKKEAQLQ
jgi:hypothetical protein